MIDIRSDTVTRPSKGMMDSILSAELGDDVFGEDPTVNELQKRCAEITGKEKALITPTGCMANQLAVKAHTKQGDEVILERESHIINYETSAPAVISNVQLFPIPGINGVMNPSEIEKHIRPKDYYFPLTSLICLENTHNRAGGTIQPLENIKSISEIAKNYGIKMHLDGARIFNASVATGIGVSEYAEYFDSVSFCFSKGLGEPVCSVLCGIEEFINIAHNWRKILGGGMRQAGILAGAALYALNNNINRLSEDHEKAKYFAGEISGIEGIELALDTVQTNIVVFSTSKYGKQEFISLLKDKGVLISSGSFENLRAVFHIDVTLDEVKTAVNIIRTLF